VSPELAVLTVAAALVLIGALVGGLLGYMLGVSSGWRRCEEDRLERERAMLEYEAAPGFELHSIEGGR
jgi:membrane protein DedA with SNARE-associated domain